MTIRRFQRLIWVLLATLCLWPVLASAQSCSADAQCANGGRSTFACIGDTLIVKRSICAGTCREVEERRQNCGSRMIGGVECSGNIATRSGGGCNASLGTCVTGSGCARTVQQCQNGCTCSPEPRCR